MAIIKELRDELNCELRQIARAIEIDHALLLRFADGKKNLARQPKSWQTTLE